MMLNGLREALTHKYVTLDGPYTGKLVGEGDPSAISFDGEVGKGAVLALHGFAGTPNEVRVVTDAAVKRGLFVRAPRLAGHGPDARELMNVGWADWVKTATDALFDLQDRAQSRVVVCGLSLGALLATHLAATFPERVVGLVAMSNATWLRLPSPGLLLAICDRVKPLGNAFYIPKSGADIREPEAKRKHLTYDVNPAKSAVEVLRAGRLVRGELAAVKCPTLVVHGRRDQVCPVSNAERFARALGTTDVEVAVMPNSGHIVSVDWDRGTVAGRVDEFLARRLWGTTEAVVTGIAVPQA
jgi:carboxylesterase